MTDRTIPGGQGGLRIYLATPEGAPPWPGVVVLLIRATTPPMGSGAT